MLERFELEAHAAFALNHPDIFTTYGIGGSTGKTPMEFMITFRSSCRSTMTQECSKPQREFLQTSPPASGARKSFRRASSYSVRFSSMPTSRSVCIQDC
jgi:hypothetical protein